MKTRIFYVEIDTEGRDDLVLATSQVVQTIRATLAAPAAPRNGMSSPAAQLVSLPAAAPAPSAGHDGHDLPGVSIRPPAETVDTGAPEAIIYDHCVDCGEPKSPTKSPRCKGCAIRRGQRAARMEKTTRHNDNAED